MVDFKALTKTLGEMFYEALTFVFLTIIIALTAIIFAYLICGPIIGIAMIIIINCIDSVDNTAYMILTVLSIFFMFAILIDICLIIILKVYKLYKIAEEKYNRIKHENEIPTNNEISEV